MKKIMRKLIFVFIIAVILFPFKLRAQTEELLGNKLRNVVQAYAAAYLKPVNKALGVTLNSGMYTNTKASNLENPIQFSFYAGLKAFGFFIKDEDKKFNLRYVDTVTQGGISTPFEFTTTNAPTFFGVKDAGVATYRDNSGIQQSQQTIGGIYRSDVAPFVLLHLEAGSIYGTDVMLRFLPKVKLGKLEDISVIGFGIKHNVSQYLKTLPVDVTVQFALQKVELNSDNINIVDSDAKVFNLTVAKRFPFVDLYAGVQYDNLSTKIKYNYLTSNNVLVPVEFEMDKINNTSGILGAAFHLGGVYVNLDGNFGKNMVLTAGIGYAY